MQMHVDLSAHRVCCIYSLSRFALYSF